jgi:AraC-like DNA-binding protein
MRARKCRVPAALQQVPGDDSVLRPQAGLRRETQRIRAANAGFPQSSNLAYGLGIAKIAYRWGFNDLTHFGRRTGSCPRMHALGNGMGASPSR